MTIFDLVQVRDYIAELDARMIRDDARASMDAEATVTDADLRRHAALCDEFVAQVRAWCHSIFTGRTAFDPAVESVWLDEGARLSARTRLLTRLAPADARGDEGLIACRAASDRLGRLFNPWLRPQLAVGPGPRSWMHQTPEMIEEGRRRIADLPPLPADWPFTDEQRRALGLP